jgi:integrase
VGYVEDLRGKKQGQGRPRWRARYRDPSGRERSKSFARRIDAERFLVSIEDAKLRGAYVDPAAGRVAFSEWAERWERTTVSLRPNTRKDYRTLLKNQVLPAFGGTTLVAIDALAVREWVAELVAGGLSAKRARKAHQVLSQILASAVDGGRLPRNVAEGIKLPKVQRKEMHFLTAAQVEALADAIEPPYGVLVRVAAYTGLRPCEYVALKVGRLDLLRGTARVAEAAPEVAGHLEWGGVKTHEARTVRLPRSVAEELGAYLADRPHGPGDLVFTAPRGGPVRSSKFVPVRFKPAIGAANHAIAELDPDSRPDPLPEELRLYDLRHTAASLMIRQGASVKAVQKQLGHATASITLDTYGHLFPDELDALAGRLEDARTDALATLARTRHGPQVVPLEKPQVSGLVGGVGGGT